jgi:HEAT repeat protein
MYAAMTLGALGPEMAESERDLAARALIRLLESPDDALVLVAIAGLQTLPSPETVPALVGMLASSALELRASAALSLAALGDPAGRPVLEEMLALRPYEEERAADRRKWPPPRVSESRCKALAALRALGSLSADALQRLAEDPDPNVRRAALGQGGSPPDR